MKTVSPYLYFNGNTEEVFKFYEQVFGSEITEKLRFGDLDDNSMGVDKKDLNKIAHISLPIGDTLLMASDHLDTTGPPVLMGNNFYLTLSPESRIEAENVFNRLKEDGQVLMPLKREFWAELYGLCRDKFGIQWKINYEGNALS